jgi:hypothetical protein
LKKAFSKLARQSPALIVAMIALFVALTGTAVATTSALITGAQIKNGSITGLDVKNKSLTARDFKGSVRGARGLRGLQGPPGPAGAQGAQGAQGIQGPPGAPNPDAATLNGRPANGLTRVARMSTSATLELTEATQTYGGVLSITAPAAGFVMVHGSSTVLGQGCTANCGVVVRIRHIQSSALSMVTEESANGAEEYGNTSHAYVFPVSAGVNTFDIRMSRINDASGAIYGWYGELAGIYSPFGATGGSTITRVADAPLKAE